MILIKLRFIFAGVAIIAVIGFLQLKTLIAPLFEQTVEIPTQPEETTTIAKTISLTKIYTAARSIPHLATDLSFSCEGYDDYVKQSKKPAESLIINLAKLMLFNGENKNDLLDTIAAEYGLVLAVEFLSLVANESTYHDNFEVIKKHVTGKIEKQSTKTPDDNFYQAMWYLDSSNISPNELINHGVSEVQRYPDIETRIWLSSFQESLSHKNEKAALFFIDQLTKQQYHPLENYQIMEAIFKSLIDSGFKVEFKQKIINQLSAVDTIFFSSTQANAQKTYDGEVLSSSLNRYHSLKYDFSALNLTDIHSLSFSSNTLLLEKFKQQFVLRTDISKTMDAKEWCKLNKKQNTLHATKRINVDTLLSQSQHFTYTSMLHNCATYNQMTLTRDYVAHHNWQVDSLFSIDNMTKERSMQEALLIQQDFPDDLSAWFSYLTSEVWVGRKQRFSHLSLLIKHGLYPKNSDILKGFRRLTVEQSLLLLKQAGDISPTNKQGATLVYNAITFGKWRLAIELIKQGYPLSLSNNAPDPLYSMLYIIGNNRALNPQTNTLIDLLVTNTHEINDWHVNAMYRLKLNNIEAFDELVTRYPQLYPFEPKQLVTFDCGDSLIPIF